jgi:2-isopropylmalate synthase
MPETPQVLLYDTLLRAGSQMEGIAFSLDDKVAIAHRLDALGIHYVEGGFPGSNEKDKAFFDRMRERPLQHAKLVAFGGTRKIGASVNDDFNMQALIETGTPVVTLVGKASSYQVRVALETTNEENLAMVRESIEFMVGKGKETHFDAEHFFDGYHDDPEYSLQVLRTAHRAGAGYLVLCDTNGGSTPDQVVAAIEAVQEAVPGAQIGIHCHNDCELAVANSLAAVGAGATQVQGCVNGYGERCGNANLSTVIANLQLKQGIRVVSDEQLQDLTNVSLFVAELANMPLNGQAAYVGQSAFAHKAGYHVAAIVKDEDTYQHIKPAAVGNGRRVLVSELSGQRNIAYKLQEQGLDFPLSKEETRALLDRVKTMESKGYQYEGAEASFELLAHRIKPSYTAPFTLEDFLIVERKDGSGRTQEMVAEAMTKVCVDSVIYQTASEGSGPVHALDQSVRKGLREAYPHIDRVHLVDYKVRILDAGAGTESNVRVLIESTDGEHIWSTVGSSADVIEASWLALTDAFEYFLLKYPEWSAASDRTV